MKISALSTSTHTLSYRKVVTIASTRALVSSIFVCLMAGGCGSGPTATGTGIILTTGSLQIQGRVHGGQQPVNGAIIQLYEVGTSGYGGAAKPLISKTVTSLADGSFSITGDYTPDTGAYCYLTAAGGDSGSGGSNAAIALMAAIGPCSNLTASSFINVNEVTTVAAAYAMAHFAGTALIGTTLLAQGGSLTQSPADTFGTSSTNVQGLANAMATAQVMASYHAGSSPGNNTNASALVEYWQVNTIADILASCINTIGPSSSNCLALFGNVSPINGSTPADTLQAALALALNPTLSAGAVTNLYNLIPASPPFLPTADSTAGAITDFSIGVTYAPVIPGTATPDFSGPSLIAFDSAGNAWITTEGATAFPVVELDPTGNPVQAGPAGVYAVANYLLSGTATQITGGGTSVIPYGIAIDTADDAWAADLGGNALFRITGSGGLAGGPNGGGATGTTPAVGYSIQAGGGLAASKPAYVAIDGQNNVWFTQSAGASSENAACGAYTLANKAIGGFLAGSYGKYLQGGAGSYSPWGLAIDGGGSYDSTTAGKIAGAPFLWASYLGGGSGGPATYYGAIGQYYTTGTSVGCATPLNTIAAAAAKTVTQVTAINPSGSDSINLSGQPIGIAIDHGGNVWIVSNSYVDVNSTIISSISKMTPNYGTAFTYPQADANFTFKNFQIGTGGASNKYSPYYVAIDGAGNAWVSGNAGSTTVGSGVVELNNSGTALSPLTGYFGSTYTGASKNTRILSVNRGIAVDISGNVWLANNNASSVTVIVGAATPVVTPLSVGVKNNTLGTAP